ncbi:MAG: hypothetical protein QG591_1738, partial [Planctomycetota bacterium]|nr:hypothetical protein [Planctomycetota bacterium]
INPVFTIVEFADSLQTTDVCLVGVGNELSLIGKGGFFNAL